METEALVKELRAGLVGVTPGPWVRDEDEGRRRTFFKNLHGGAVAILGWARRRCTGNAHRDAAHIARCSPENIAALLDHVEALSSENERKLKAIHEAIGDFVLQHVVIDGKSANNIADDILAEAEKAIARAALQGGRSITESDR